MFMTTECCLYIFIVDFQRYSLNGDGAPFSINETTGEFFSTSWLDRETVSSYSLAAVAHDLHPEHPLSSSATVLVTVGDVNDHSPRFLYGPYVANVPAELTKGNSVHHFFPIIIFIWT